MNISLNVYLLTASAKYNTTDNKNKTLIALTTVFDVEPKCDRIICLSVLYTIR